MLFILDNSRIHPRHSYLWEGSDITFRCDNKKSVFKKWLFNDKPSLQPNVKTNRNTLTIHKLTQFNQGYYECQGDTYEIDQCSGKTVKFYARSLLEVTSK